MADLVRTFDNLMGETAQIEGFETISELKGFFENVAEQTEDLQEQATAQLIRMREDHEDLRSGMGMRDKILGGRFGGDKGKSADSKELAADIETTDGLVDNVATFQESFNNDVMEQAMNIIAADDEDFAQTVKYQGIMSEAVEFTEEVLKEVDEALDALEDAADAEEDDLMTDSAWLDMESDAMNAQAADEVQDVTNILRSYREFLTNIGEAANGLHGSDFDFTWGDMMTEDFFGDFWGGSEMLDKIARGQDQMADLRNKIVQLFESFAEDCDNANEQIEARINEEWDNA